MENRLLEMQQRLRTLGVQDVKFFFAPGVVQSRPRGAVMSGVADFLEAYLYGRGTEVDRIGDRPPQ